MKCFTLMFKCRIENVKEYKMEFKILIYALICSSKSQCFSALFELF